MSAGTKVYTLRIPDALYAELSAVAAARNQVSAKSPWTFSSFVTEAIREKLDKMERSRTKRKKGVKRNARRDYRNACPAAQGQSEGRAAVLPAGEGQRGEDASVLVQPGEPCSGPSDSGRDTPDGVDLSSL